MTRRGVVYIAFGKQYDYQCLCSAVILRHFTNLPIFVITNLAERSLGWRNVPGVEFDYHPSPNPEEDKRNRAVKTSLDLYSPFDVTLFCDTDTAVQTGEFERGFDEAEKHDAMFSIRNVATVRGHLPDLNYKKAFDQFKMTFPATIYKEGVFFFKKGEGTRRLFSIWLDCWEKMAVGRDMPPLFAACQLAQGVDIGVLPYGWDSRDGHIIMHGHGDFHVPGLPRITKYKATITAKPEWKKVPPVVK